MQYYEVCISKEPVETDDDNWICIKGTRKPTVAEAQEFCSKDAAAYGGNVIGVFPIGEDEARQFYDFSSEKSWPIFGQKEEGDNEQQKLQALG